MTQLAANLLRVIALSMIDAADRLDPPPPPRWTDHITTASTANTYRITYSNN